MICAYAFVHILKLALKRKTKVRNRRTLNHSGCTYDLRSNPLTESIYRFIDLSIFSYLHDLGTYVICVLTYLGIFLLVFKYLVKVLFIDA